MSEPTWRAGAATISFPVPSGVPLGGYMARTGTATGTHDPLLIGALTLACGDQRLTILTADVVAVDHSLVEQILRETNLDDGELLVCASHTHSGPAGIVDRLHPAWPPAGDEPMRARFVKLASECIRAAAHRLQRATLSVAAVEPDEPVWTNRNRPQGPADRRISTLVARRLDGSIAAVVLHFACHPTVLGHDNLLVSADLPGAARRALASRLGDPRAPIIFVNGAAGSTSTRYTRAGSSFATCDSLGDLAARSAYEAIIATNAATPISPWLRHARAVCHLTRSDTEGAAVTSAPVGQPAAGTPAARIAETRRQGAEMARRAAGNAWPDTVPLASWVLGDQLALLAIPGELTAVPAQRIEAASPFSITRIAGYANGYTGYLPDQGLYDEGTYEALASPYAAGCGEQVAHTASVLLASLA